MEVGYGAFENDIETLHQIRRLYDFLPLNNKEAPPVRQCFDEINRLEESLDTVVPSNSNQPYDMHEVIQKVVDEADFFEIQPDHASASSNAAGAKCEAKA